MNIKPFVSKSGFTQLNNDILDHIMPSLSPNGWKLLCFIIRKTTGWNKKQDQLSYSQIKAGTGMVSDQTVNTAIGELKIRGIVLVTDTGSKWDGNSYALNLDYEIDVPTTEIVVVEPTTKIVATTKIVVEPTTKIVVEPTTKIVDTKEIEINKNKYIQPGPFASKLLEICRINYDTASDKLKSELAETIKVLGKIDATVEQLDSFKRFWGENWRGKGGSPPTLKQVRDLWGEFQDWVKTSGNGHQPKKVRISAI